MKITEAIQRLSYTISNANKPNETDKLALNKIIQDLNKSAEETTQEHLLFAKLYAVILREFSMHYNNIDFANEMINKQLSTSLDYHLELLRIEFCRISLSDFFRTKGVVDPLLKKENFEQYKHLYGVKFGEVVDLWDKENLEAQFKLSINQSIINYKNHV
jgi:hypothetical protein